MLGNRQWRLDLVAAVLLLMGVVLALAVLSHDVADQPNTVFPANAAPNNLLGPPGAWIASILLQSLGIAAYVLLTGWFVLVLLLFLRRDWLAWSRRIAGRLVLVPGVAVPAAQAPDILPINHPASPRGTIGAALAQILGSTFSPTVQVVLLASVIAVAVALALDVLVRRLARLGWRGVTIAAQGTPNACRRLAQLRFLQPRLAPQQDALGPTQP